MVICLDAKQKAFYDKMYRANIKNVVRTGYYLTRSWSIAEELAQDAFIIFLLKIDIVYKHPNPGGWLMQTMHNLANNEMKRKYRQDVLLDEVFTAVLGNDLKKMDAQIALWEILPDNFPQNDRELLDMVFKERLPFKQIAERLGISEGACRVRYHRVKHKIRPLLKDDENWEEDLI